MSAIDKFEFALEEFRRRMEELENRSRRFTGPGGGDGSGSDSPIIITNGSFSMISINDDFFPTLTSSNPFFIINKSNLGIIKIRFGKKADQPITINNVGWVMVLTDASTGATMTITGTPTTVNIPGPSSNNFAYVNWAISVLIAGTTPIARFTMNGGESRIAHATFGVDTGTISINAGAPTPLSSPANFSIHFR